MTTVATICTRALRLLRVIDPGETPSNGDMQTAIEALNAMMVRQEASMVSVGWQPVSLPSDELPAPPECEEWIAAGVACRLGPEYGQQPDQMVVNMYTDGLKATLRDIAVVEPLRLRNSLPGKYTRWNIYNDAPASDYE